MTTPTVSRIIRDLIDREGDYVNHPSDKGGATRWGVTEAVARQNGYHGDMRDLPRELAEQIYLRRYWRDPGFDRVAVRSPAVAEELLDAGVLSGPSRAAHWLQTALNRLNLQGRLYPDMREDSQIGPTTLAALDAYLHHRRDQDAERVLLCALNCLQGHFFIITAVDHRERNEDFLFGWLAHRVAL